MHFNQVMDTWVNLQALVPEQARIEGVLTLAAFPRVLESPFLNEVAHASDIKLHIDLRFFRDDDAHMRMTGLLDWVLPMVCQRCLENFDQPIRIKLDVLLVTTEDESEKLAATDTLTRADCVLLNNLTPAWADLLEDDLLLSIPLLPKHRAGACRDEVEAMLKAVPTPEPVSRQNPFHILEGLYEK